MAFILVSSFSRRCASSSWGAVIASVAADLVLRVDITLVIMLYDFFVVVSIYRCYLR